MTYKCWLDEDRKVSKEISVASYESAQEAAEYFLNQLDSSGYWAGEEVPYKQYVCVEDEDKQIKKFEVFTEYEITFTAYEI